MEQMNIQVNSGRAEVFKGVVYEGLVYQISCLDIPLANMRHRRIIVPSARLIGNTIHVNNYNRFRFGEQSICEIRNKWRTV